MDGIRDNTLIKAGALLVILIGAGIWMTTCLLRSVEPELKLPAPPELARSRVIATRELQPYTLLKEEDLKAKTGTQETSSVSAIVKPPTVDELKDRYLLVKVRSGGEIKREMVAPREATPLLADAVAIGIPASSPTSL